MIERFNEQIEDLGYALFDEHATFADLRFLFSELNPDQHDKMVEVCEECIHYDDPE